MQKFLSTPSARRATNFRAADLRWLAISIHALREEGDAGEFIDLIHKKISIHALREEGDPRRYHPDARRFISIHALREEGDLLGSPLW